jgi:hypothetical protein
MSGLITPADDYPLHQTAAPFRDTGSDPNAYDRFFFNGYDRDATTFFACALGQYPGRNIMDGAFSVVVDGTQHNVLASRILGADRLDTQVGPIRVEIVQPLRHLRIVVDDPESGIAADLHFHARGPAFEEQPYRWGPGLHSIMDYTRLTQSGTWVGTVTAGGRTVAVDPARFWGTRDRSWGVRPVGGAEANRAPDGLPGFYWLWAPVNFDDATYLWDVNETPDGHHWHEEAMWAPVGATEDPLAAPVESGTARYRRAFKPGTRHARSFTLDLSFPGGERRLEFEPVFPFAMRGIGYTHPACGHGVYQGGLLVTRETYVTADLDERDPFLQHIQELCRVHRDDGPTGIGILEQLIFGPHAPSGLHDILDMAGEAD